MTGNITQSKRSKTVSAPLPSKPKRAGSSSPTASAAVQQDFAISLRQAGASGEASFILGGQIRGEEHGLCLIYPQGNAVMATDDTPFLQIGESKLKELVASGALVPLAYSRTQLFWGEHLIRFCGRASK